ncbi:Z1 domain-containing protein [Pedobacter sp. UC225_61]|uniref:Z1 domain-containing protein n=1 Tax=Pedobacter sp. UC225_61 TaxID=3374623 RepID=UPI0037BAA239
MENFECVEMVKTLLKGKASERENITISFFNEVRTEIVSILKILPGYSSFDENSLNHFYDIGVKEFQSINPIEIDPSYSLNKKGFITWLTDNRKTELKDDYIKRYLAHLKTKGRSDKVLEEIAKSSEKILSKLGDPKADHPFYVKGLVVGSVQSGKTGNFNAVINRAIDAGYSLIIVLSGIMEDLRSQTQLRIEEDIIGDGTLDISKDTKGDKGVGKIRKFGELGDKNVAQVYSITSYKSDFKKSVKEADFSLNHKNILVCKKNTGVLKNLLIWLSDYLRENAEKHDIPFLIVDDEADNASLNNLGKKGADYASIINGHIRALLDLFTRKTYLGYTATPFANVLQDRNNTSAQKWPINYKIAGNTVYKEFTQVSNIFPDDFIELLNNPTNYIGAKQIFETVLDDNLKLPLVEIVRDSDVAFPARITLDDGKERATARNDHFPVTLPKSLEEATACFILSIALRLSRVSDMLDSGFLNPHHTMLIHVSRFIPWQNKTKDLIITYIEKLESKLNNELPNNKQLIYGQLEIIWNRYYSTIVLNIKSYLPAGYVDEFLSPKSYEDIKPHLIDAIRGVEVKAINSETGDKVVYAKDASGNGKKIIAVGGNRLSRGFTLEGLTVNYFIRNTNFSDTLLQMGRWFGYRPGYLDACKIFTTIDAVNKFDSTTRAIEELEAEFIKMNRLDKSPAEFVLRVRKHPGALKITRPAILKDTKIVNWSYQDTLVQTTKFKVNSSQLLESAWDRLREFIRGNNFTEDKGFLKTELSAQDVIEFLELPNTFEDFEMQSIIKFIQLCVQKNKLKNWTIAIKIKGNGRVLRSDISGLDRDIELSVRSGPREGHFRTLFTDFGVFAAAGKSANIVSAGSDFDLLLSEDQKQSAINKFKIERQEYFKSKNKIPKNEDVTIPERVYREAMTDDQCLLNIYLMDIKSVFLSKDNDKVMDDMFIKNNINEWTPLIGYAIGFPKISPDPGGEYVHGGYDLDIEVEEWDQTLDSTEE